MRLQKGFSLIELMIVLGIVLVIAGIAIPVYKSAVDGIHLQKATRNYADILQRARLTAATSNTYHATGIQFFDASCMASCDLIAYVDTADTNINPVSAYAAPEPMVMLGSDVVWDQAGAPATNDLLGKVFPNNGGNALAYPPVFGPRGMPCAVMSVTGGKVCSTQAGDIAFATYFQSSLGKWQAVSVNPAGRIQLWSYDPGAAAWNQL
ncbi:MAG TPA: prepilin-type N-terminal cleavage/methylation domain-containing protein [Terriglobales bacterium]|nr:prepilin-type N-terminal cleavage/methylation domain-containing protein [Terriglobales bacterium]